jgi:endo-1,4-beta-D-glucanase Y
MEKKLITHPFPQAKENLYSGMHCSYSATDRNRAVEHFYDLWKKKYLLKARSVKDGYKVSFNKRHETVSEAIGYGMLITVQMAGYDPNAQEYFDGLNLFRKAHPSKGNPAFMSWKVDDRKKSPTYSATDGDVDMAMALLMAEQQWGDPKYRKEALKIIHAISKDLVRKDGSLRLGDWQVNKSVDKERGEGTRTSDFEMATFLVFYQLTKDGIWNRVEDCCYNTLEQLQREYAPKTGLFPDFAVKRKDEKWAPAHKGFLEGDKDGDFGYNACRVPWRIGFAAIYDAEPRAKRTAERLMKWVVSTHEDPKDFKAGYRLDGTPVTDASKMVFTAPTGVAAMATGNQKWLDKTFYLAAKTTDSYFSDSVNMLCLLIMSGNYWIPHY